MAKEMLKGIAEHRQLSNDLFWDCFLSGHDKDGNTIYYHPRWRGYNDNYWWQNVEPKTRIVKDKDKFFKIDRNTLDVVEVDEREVHNG